MGQSFKTDVNRVFILYGLRRTGKTTLIRQLFGEMAPGDLAKAAFVQVNSRNSLADLNADLKILEGAGFKYVFIDEVTMLADFIEGAALFADVFASCGMKIVLSGTDSLGFVFSEDEQLYDRAEMLHTTFIPYREFERVLGLNGIDGYIQYGGTMSMGGYEYNKGRMMEEIVLLETKMARPNCHVFLSRIQKCVLQILGAVAGA